MSILLTHDQIKTIEKRMLRKAELARAAGTYFDMDIEFPLAVLRAQVGKVAKLIDTDASGPDLENFVRLLKLEARGKGSMPHAKKVLYDRERRKWRKRERLE